MKLAKTLCAVAALLLVGGIAQADMLITATPLGGGDSGSYEVGNQFTITSPITVSALGVYSYGGWSLTPDGDDFIALYALGNTTPLAAVGVPTGTPVTQLDGNPVVSNTTPGYAWIPVALTLPAGTYRLVDSEAVWTHATYRSDNGLGPVTFNPIFTNVQGVYANNSSYAVADAIYPTNPDAYTFSSPNMQFTASPEPATMALLAIGGIGALLRRRK